MFNLRKQLYENLIISVFISFVFMSVWGVGMSMKMADGQMSSCPFTADQTAMCQMSATEHIIQWQQMFLGIPAKTDLLTLVTVLLAIVITPFAKQFSKFKKLTELAARLFAYHKARLVKIFDTLVIAFSDGILNPKIYEPARI